MLSGKLDDESDDGSSCSSSSSSSSSSSEDSSDEEESDDEGDKFALKNIVSDVFGAPTPSSASSFSTPANQSVASSSSPGKANVDLEGTEFDSISMDAHVLDNEEELKMENIPYKDISEAKEFYPSSNGFDSYEEEETMDMSDLSEAMLEELGMVENSLLEESKMFNYMLDEESLPAYWLDTSNVVVSSQVDDVMVYGFQPKSPESSTSDVSGSKATNPAIMEAEVMDLEFLLNSEVIESKGIVHINSEPEFMVPKIDGAKCMEITKTDFTNPNAQESKTLKPEAEYSKVKPTSPQLSANESKCPQCGRLFKNASALHNHTRKGTKCKSGEEQNVSKQNLLKGFQMKSQKIKHSFQQNLPKWTKSPPRQNLEGVKSLKSGGTGDLYGGLNDSKVGSKTSFHQMWKQRESEEELKCLDCPGMMFKNDTSFKVHMRGHKSRERVSAAERWPENAKATASVFPGSLSTHTSARTALKALSPKTPALSSLPEPPIISSLQLPLTSVEAKPLIANPKPFSPVQSETIVVSASPPSFHEGRGSIKEQPEDTQMQTTKMVSGPLHCPETECSKIFGNATQRNCHARQHKVAGVRRSMPASNRNFG